MALTVEAVLDRLDNIRKRIDCLPKSNTALLGSVDLIARLTQLETATVQLEHCFGQSLDTFTTRLSADGDEYGLDSSDEAELLSITNSPQTHRLRAKRKSEEPQTFGEKRRCTEPSPVAVRIANDILRNHFGMASFRLKQEAAIARLLDGHSAVVVFPTGGGKSLCYQVPALAFKEIDRHAGIRQGGAESGITLVVSPLIALMKDQVDALERKNIRAAVLDSTKTKEEYLKTVNAMRDGTLSILYCAPERLNNEGFVASIANVKGGVRLFAVDEAHCISEWGHAFRPDYLKVARFAKEIQAERVVCLTATATPTVARDICKAFDIPEDGLFRTPTYRPNLRLLAYSYQTKKESFPKLVALLGSKPGPSIIYVTLQKQTEELAQSLRNSGFKARHFHAGMNAVEKTACQDAFMTGDDIIIVATIAFGMGIDKPNIRNVIHYDIPRSLEGYSQEIGRAGRDGHESRCLLFLCAEDLHLRENFARGDLPSKKSVAGLLREIFASKIDGTGCIEAYHPSQTKEYDIKVTVLKNIYAQLELHFGLLRETTPKYTSYSYERLGRLENDRSLAANAILTTSKMAKTLHHIDVEAAARSHGIERSVIIAKLQTWHDAALIDLRTSGVVNKYRILKPFPTTKEDTQQVIDNLYAELEQREQRDLLQMKQVMDLINGSACFSRTLAKHFGDTLPDEEQECGHCTWCETHKPVPVVTPKPKPFDFVLFRKVLEAVPDRDDPRFLARVAFGVSSPRVTQSKLSRHPVFESMMDFEFTTLLRAFEKECAAPKQVA